MKLVIFLITRGIRRLEMIINRQIPDFNLTLLLPKGNELLPLGFVHLRIVQTVKIEIKAAALSRQ